MYAIDNEILLGEVCRSLSQGKRVKLRAKGDSMRPFIRGNVDTFVLAPVSVLRKGDVVLARIDGGRYVVHRIIDMKGERLTLMGDGNLYEKEECTPSDIYGVVDSIVRFGKERNVQSSFARISAAVWRSLLPLRRIRFRIMKKNRRR